MQAVLDSKDYDTITAEVLKRITAKFELVPKQTKSEWLTLDEFKAKLPITKDKTWLKTFLLVRPEFKGQVINLNRGTGYKVKVSSQMVDWVNQHVDEIEWDKPLPKEVR
ncbi:hypothetical protein L2520_03710 [Limosilactobacillus vaginalis]|uniref:DUF771 domain-containing protein n=1 Tax=Limosilactobacillus vaginalis TaxID=1633 RepID=A0ABT4K6P7_9LACO|nr:hypothetical protein [Limosilactobacillus vaginalis]MCZ3746529.1 hypothetical protein [Limosilactobacillus vaginalis]MCZ3751579.1 hypothetical protein [Limosilactobacillus vaginalis]MCZ3753265.1 hypothetical protein [Limosilactobacillus vaginalis]MCZ3755049.1 hypothetical protein [Limosilactobacillus vaginalis]MCZ3756751.1 hypothetical protein [Limosilactobacillus vaginalis]